MIVFRAGKNWAYDWSSYRQSTPKKRMKERLNFPRTFLAENDMEIENDYAAHETGHGFFPLVTLIANLYLMEKSTLTAIGGKIAASNMPSRQSCINGYSVGLA